MPRQEGVVSSPRTGTALIESTDVPAALVSGDGDIVQWNAAFEALTGYRLDAPPPAWTEFVLEDSPAESRQRASLALSMRTVFAGDLVCRKAGDAPLWCDVTLVPVSGPHPYDRVDAPFMMALLHESTSRRVAESVLGGVELADRFVLDRVQLGIVVHDAATRILYANAKAAELLGITYDRLLGAGRADPRWEFFTVDEVPMSMDDFPVSRVIRTGQPLQGYIVGVRRPNDRAIIWAMCQAFPVRAADGQLAEVVVSFTDVTSLMESERERARADERLQLIFSATNDALWDLDLVTGEGWCSNRYWEMFGYVGRESRVTADDLAALLHPDDRDAAYARVEGWIAGGARTYEHEVRMCHRLGHDVHVLVRGIILRDDTGRAVRVAGTTTDITARRNLEHRLRQTQKLESVGHLAGGVAHDFNNLLAIISGNLELLEEAHAEGEDMGPLVREAREAAMRGATLTRRLLAFSRQQPLRLEIVNVAPALQTAMQMVKRLLPASVEIRMSCADELPSIMADAALLENALLNLAINARDAMNGRGVLTVSAGLVFVAESDNMRGELVGGDYLRVNVTDTGCGMSKAVADQAIEPFFTTKEVGQGTGLGLSMVYGFLRQCGGTMQIRSAEGQGTTVSLYFPVPSVPRTPDAPSTPAASRYTPAPRAEVVLVVEDDASVRALCVRELATLGFRTLEAKDGPTALDMFARAPRVDLVLTDIVMPGGMNGNEVATALTSRQPGLKVVFMSGYHADILNDLLLDPDTHLLSKPFTIAELATTLSQILPAEATK